MSIWFLYICRLALAILMYCKKNAIATSSYNSYWTAIWVKRNTEWSNERAYTMKKTTHKFNTYHDGLSYIQFTFGPRAFCAVCKCVYVALTKVHFPPTLWFNFLCCQPKTTASLSLSPRMLHRPLYSRIATTMNIPRRARTTTVVAAVATKNENENGKIAESFTTLHEQQKLIQEPHMWCAHEKPSFYLFSDVIFFYFVCVCCCCCWCCCFFVFRIRFKNKVRFSSFRVSLRKSPSVCVWCFFSFFYSAIWVSHFLLPLPSIFGPFDRAGGIVCVLCVVGFARAHVAAANVHTRYL